jgi:inorganic pyrophosphatase
MSHTKHLGPGANTPDEINVIIEIQRGSRNKYEMDKESGMIILDRVNATMLGYPADYGYVPETLCEDGDPLDALVVIDESVPAGLVVPSRAIGVLYMVDGGEKDEKLICVPINDITKSHVREVEDLGVEFKNIVEHYYARYKDWKNDWKGAEVAFDGWGNAAEAREVIKKSIEAAK